MKNTAPPDRPDLCALLRSRKVMTLRELQEALGHVSPSTVYRRLAAVRYRSSYNFNGRYYSLHEPSRYDRHGLWSHEGIRFSRDGSLSATVLRLVQESECGCTQREMQQLLGVRVQNVVTALMRASGLVRERIGETFVYLHASESRRQRQIEGRRQHLEERALGHQEVPLEAVIEILLVLIRHPGGDPAEVGRRLRGRSPPIRIDQIRRVFDRYQLGEKKGLSTS